ncbi:hypothetical protein J6590_060271 [Homalodisca vitripennis]|nr:hypothetical protein J6590_060271 [Homalodisca vitripennis]
MSPIREQRHRSQPRLSAVISQRLLEFMARQHGDTFDRIRQVVDNSSSYLYTPACNLVVTSRVKTSNTNHHRIPIRQWKLNEDATTLIAVVRHCCNCGYHGRANEPVGCRQFVTVPSSSAKNKAQYSL